MFDAPEAASGLSRTPTGTATAKIFQPIIGMDGVFFEQGKLNDLPATATVFAARIQREASKDPSNGVVRVYLSPVSLKKNKDGSTTGTCEMRVVAFGLKTTSVDKNATSRQLTEFYGLSCKKLKSAEGSITFSVTGATMKGILPGNQ